MRWTIDRDALLYAARRKGWTRRVHGEEVVNATRLGAAAGIPPSTAMYALNDGRARPSASVMCSIARALGCDVMDLMREEES